MQKSVAGHLQERHGLSQRRAAVLVKTAPRVLRYKSKRPNNEPVKQRLRELAQERPRWSYRRLHVLLRRESLVLNRKKTYRIYREEKLHFIELGKPTQNGHIESFNGRPWEECLN